MICQDMSGYINLSGFFRIFQVMSRYDCLSQEIFDFVRLGQVVMLFQFMSR
jgi:hypothetical protein